MLEDVGRCWKIRKMGVCHDGSGPLFDPNCEIEEHWQPLSVPFFSNLSRNRAKPANKHFMKTESKALHWKRERERDRGGMDNGLPYRWQYIVFEQR